MNRLLRLRFVAWLVFLLMTGGVSAEWTGRPARPVIPARTFVVTAFGATGDGATMKTAAIQRAIDACAQAGGGEVVVPAGVYLTGPLTLASNLDFYLAPGAVLKFSDRAQDFPVHHGACQNCLSARDCHDLAITGDGVIDGSGVGWWAQYPKHPAHPLPPQPHRPHLLVLTNCTRVEVRGITLRNSPNFHLVPEHCTEVTIDRVRIQAPPDSPNTDGLDPSGRDFLITHCIFDVGDDCIAIKPSGAPHPGAPSCENFLIEHCVFLHGHGLSVGGQAPGGLRNLVVRDCRFDGTQAGIRLKAGRGEGGLVENLTYENLTMRNVKVAVFITSYYPSIPRDPARDPVQAVTSRTPVWRHIRIAHLRAEGGAIAGRLIGLPEMPLSDITLEDVSISAGKGMEVINARGIRFGHSVISAAKGPPLIALKADVSGFNP